jgi:hypothetical protein
MLKSNNTLIVGQHYNTRHFVLDKEKISYFKAKRIVSGEKQRGCILLKDIQQITSN